MAEAFDFFDDSVGGPEPRKALREAERPGRATAQIALEWIEKHRERPFFFLLHLYEPHSPYEPPEPFASRHRSPYDGEVAAADAVIGEFLSGLERLGVYDRALVLLISDHGEGLGQHGEEEHGVLLYRETLRVPLLVKLPGSERAGETVEAPVGLTDLFPTVARLVSVQTPPGLPGRALLNGEPPARPPGQYSETYYPRLHLGWSPLRSLWDGRYHLIDGPRPELYDLRQDPLETKDLFSPNFEPARSLKRQLEARPESFAGPAPADPEDLRKLASLGYLTLSDDLSRGGPLPNPVDHVRELAEAGKAFGLAAEGDRARAILRLEEILRKNPRFFDARYKLAELLTREGRLREAEKAYQEVIALSPGLANAIALDLSRIQLALGKVSEAEAMARFAIAISPGEAHEVLARVAMARGDAAQALRELDLAVHAGGSDTNPPAGLDFLRGEALARLGRHAEATAAFREEIRRSPAHREAYARLAILYALEGRRVSEVRSLLDSMHAQDPRRETALLAAQTLESLGDREGASVWRRRASGR